LCIRRVVVDDGNASGTMTELHERINHAGVVSAVHTRVHDNDSFYVKGAMKSAHLIDRRGFRRVRTSRPKSKALRIAEYVGMAIAGTTRHLEANGCRGPSAAGKCVC